MISVNDSSPLCAISLDELLDIVELVVSRIARRLPSHVSREDLSSVGRLALIKTHSDASGSLQEVRALAFVRVRGAVLDELRSSDVLSRRDRAIQRAIEAARHAHGSMTDEPLSNEKLASIVGVSTQRIAQIEARAERVSNDEQIAAIPDQNTPSPAEAADAAEILSVVRSLLATLPKAQAHAVSRFYLDEASLAEIASELGVSMERVRQLRVAGEKTLRGHLQDAWQSAA